MTSDSIPDTARPTVIGSAPVGSVIHAPRHGEALLRTFAAFKHRNYRLYFFGQLVSLIGTWMQIVAQGWLVYQLTDSPFYLGLVGFARAIPVILFSLGAGVMIDRFPRRWVLVATNSSAMLLAFVLAALVFANVVQPWHILVLSLLSGVVQSFDGTARQAFVKDMVGKEDLSNAIALNSTTWNLSRIIGPALAGFTLASVGAAWCFFLNGLSFLAVIGGLSLMHMPNVVVAARKVSMGADIKEGLNYIRHNQTVLVLIAIIAVAGVFGSYDVMLPAYAQDALHVDARGLGFLSTAAGIGAVAGALLIAALAHGNRKGFWLTLGNFIFPTTLLLLALSNSFPVSLLILVGVGWAMMVQSATANSLVQLTVPDHLRGRVMSVYMLCFFGMSPLGGLQAGFIAEHFGVSAGIGFGAVIALLFSLFILWRAPRLRAIA